MDGDKKLVPSIQPNWWKGDNNSDQLFSYPWADPPPKYTTCTQDPNEHSKGVEADLTRGRKWNFSFIIYSNK